MANYIPVLFYVVVVFVDDGVDSCFVVFVGNTITKNTNTNAKKSQEQRKKRSHLSFCHFFSFSRRFRMFYIYLVSYLVI